MNLWIASIRNLYILKVVSISIFISSDIFIRMLEPEPVFCINWGVCYENILFNCRRERVNFACYFFAISPHFTWIMDSKSCNFNMDEQTSIFTTASETKVTRNTAVSTLLLVLQIKYFRKIFWMEWNWISFLFLILPLY